MHIVFVQYGDYRSTVLSFAQGGEETYAAQRYSVDIVADLARRCERVTVVCVNADPYDERLPNGVYAQGLRLYSQVSVPELVKRVAELRPTHLVSRSPIPPLLRWALRANVRTLPLLATSFPTTRGLRTRYRYWRVARVLREPAIQVVGNHNVNSCLDLRRIGVPPEKIVPWDWPATVTPDERAPKTRTDGGGPVRLFYAGVISADKGVAECVGALRILRDRGRDARLTLAGAGDVERFQRMATELGVSEFASFLGRIPHQQVLKLMNEHDLCVVASRHTYPEGLPLTIYDSYCSRTPLIASDHPMFRGKVEDGFAALVFRASSAESLAERAEEALASPELYARLSRNSAEAWRRLQLPVRWGELLLHWLDDSSEGRAYFARFNLAAGGYAGAK
ncbi:MAG TPA: glycosyltransferase family 4 protein [Myxococcota bacterium]|nr:glycosyltransferase family 4 protein [Myxococcota bacterium]